MSDYTIQNLNEVEDSAAKFGYEETHEARFAGDSLDAEQTGLSLHRVKPDCRYPFGHRHDEAEEVYVVLSGSGRISLDDEVVEVSRLDAVRIGPGVARAVEAGPEGLEYIAVGPHFEGDGELLPGWWAGKDRAPA